MEKPVSVIIPLAPAEDAWRDLVLSLELPTRSEVLLACGSDPVMLEKVQSAISFDLRVVTGGSGRAEQMNAGAAAAVNDWLWFLHADSRLTQDTLPALERCLDEDQEGLFFFDLKFLADGPRAMTWNERAVKWRSDFLKIPFGDQGFLIRRQVFEDLGGYPEDLAYGEDHVFVWRVRQGGFSVEGVGAGLFTSARKYRKGGWLKVTVLHVWLTVKQAVPQWIKLQRLRIGRLIS